jgi:hypothetical protein
MKTSRILHLFSGDGKSFDPNMGTDAAAGEMALGFDVDDRLEDLTNISSHGSRIDTGALAFVDQPAVKGQGEGALEGLGTRMEGLEGVN